MTASIKVLAGLSAVQPPDRNIENTRKTNPSCKRLVVLVGQKKAIAIAVRNVSGRRRWSKLSEWLRPKPPVSRQFGMAS
jgi:hypothetical protein